MSDDVLLIGPSYSVYVRIARLALMEKGVPFRLEEFDVFDDEDIPADYLEHHPFKRVPVLRHTNAQGGFELYETSVIARYVDEAFAGPPLRPTDTQQRARMNQVIAVLDNYGYWPMVRVVYAKRPGSMEADEAAVAAALPEAERCLAALARLFERGAFLSGADFGLADIHAIPIFSYFLLTPEGKDLLAAQPALTDWWDRVKERPSVAVTRFAAETA